MSQSTIKTTEQHLVLLLLTLNIFCFYSKINVAEFEQVNAGWTSETVVSDRKFVASNCEKYIVLWAGKICWAIYFHLYSRNLSLRKDKFSKQHLKKISQTLQYKSFTSGIAILSEKPV